MSCASMDNGQPLEAQEVTALLKVRVRVPGWETIFKPLHLILSATMKERWDKTNGRKMEPELWPT